MKTVHACLMTCVMLGGGILVPQLGCADEVRPATGQRATSADGLRMTERNLDTKGRTESELLANLGENSALQRALAAAELGRRGAKKWIDRIKPLLTDPVAFVRLDAAESVLTLGDASGLDTLRALVAEAEKDPNVARRASLALARRGFYTDMAMSAMSDECWVVRSEAVHALSNLSDRDAAYRVMEIGAQDKDERVRLSAAIALGHFQESRAIEVLASLRSDPSPTVRAAVAKSLGDTRMFDAISVLLNMLDDDSTIVAAPINAALVKLTGRAMPHLPSTQAASKRAASEWRAWWEANKSKFPPNKLMGPEPNRP